MRDFGLWIYTFDYYATGEGRTIGIYMGRGPERGVEGCAREFFGFFAPSLEAHAELPEKYRHLVPDAVFRVAEAPNFTWKSLLHFNYA